MKITAIDDSILEFTNYPIFTGIFVNGCNLSNGARLYIQFYMANKQLGIHIEPNKMYILDDDIIPICACTIHDSDILYHNNKILINKQISALCQKYILEYFQKNNLQIVD